MPFIRLSKDTDGVKINMWHVNKFPSNTTTQQTVLYLYQDVKHTNVGYFLPAEYLHVERRDAQSGVR